MGVWRWGSEVTARKMSRFLSMVTRYMDRKRIKSKGCSSGSSESPRRKNSETLVRFTDLCCLDTTGKRERELETKEISKWVLSTVSIFWI